MRLARRPLLGTLTYASLVLALSTCELSKVLSTPAPRKVVLSFPGDSTLIMGSGLKPTLQVTIDGAPIIDPEIRFTSSDTSVVAVSPRGDSLIARKLGAATITASLEGTLLPDPRPSAADTIYVVPKELTIAPSAVTFSSLGDSVTLTAVAIDANNQVIPNIPVTWESSDPAAVSVSALGVLVAKNNTTGPTTVSGKLAGITVSAPVTVAQQLDHFVFTPSRQTLDAIGATVTIGAGGRDRRGNEITGLTGLEWQSGNAGVLSVTSAGVVTALDNGLSFVRVSRGPVSDTVDIDVEQQATSVDIVASAGVAIGAVGGTLRLVARSFDRRDIEVRQKKASWLSLDGNVARVDTTGVVEGLGPGTARIVARVDAAAETLSVSVSDDPAGIQVSPAVASLTSVGAVLQLSAAVRNSLGAPIPAAPVSWRTPDALVASVTATGQVQALGVGIARIIATSGTTADTATVTISDLPDQVNIVLTEAVLASVNDSLVPEVAVFNALGAPLPVTSLQWSSEDPAVARVTIAGIIIATGVGAVWVKAANPVNPSRCDSTFITVTNAPASVVLSAASDVLTAVGRTRTYSGEVRNARGALIQGAEITWSSTNILVVTVSGGFVTARGAGDALIIGAAGAKADTVTITVTNAVISIEILPASASLTTIGDTLITLRVVARNDLDDVIPGVTASWRTPDVTLAEVLADGRVVALAVGTARVIANVGAIADTAPVTITNVPDQVNIVPAQITMASVNDQTAPEIVITNSRGVALDRSSVTWSSDDPLVARVAVTGTITAVAAGTTWIKAFATGNSSRRDSVLVTVTNAPFTVVMNDDRDTLTAVGRTRTYAADVRNEVGALLVDYPVEFRSANTAVGTVIASTGVVTAREIGTTAIIAQAGSKADTVLLTVLNTAVTLEIIPASASITTVGDTLTTLSAVARNDLGEVIAGPPVTWRTPDVAIAEVISDGRVRALAVGAVRVIAQSAAAADTAVVTITNVPDLVDILAQQLTMASIGDQDTPAATIENARQATLPRSSVTWTTDDPLVARVSLDGTITAVGIGTTFIKAVSPGNALRRDSVEVTVTNAPFTVVLNAETDVITAVGRTRSYFAEVRNAAGALLPDYPVEFRSTATSVATVIASTGVVSAVGTGGTLIIAQAGTKADTVQLTVLNTPVSVDLTPAVAEITSLNDVFGLQAVARNDLNEVIPNPELSWRSVDETVATVDVVGVVTGLAVGTTKIIVTAGSKADTTVLAVSNHPAQIDIIDATISLTSLEDSIAPAATIKNGLGVTLPRTAATWSSDDASIARVSGTGMIVARDVGTTIIRATSGSVTDFVEVVVTNAPASVVLDAVLDTLTKTGQVLGYTATVRNAANAVIANPNVTWTSTAPGFASVIPTSPGATSANATALGNGTTLIIASAGIGAAAKADTATLVVTNPTRIYVDNSSVATPRVGTLARPFERIQDAVNAVDVSSDTVIVKPGNSPYSETVNIARSMTVTGDSAAFVAAPPTSRDPGLLPRISHDTGSTGIIVGAAGATIKYLRLHHDLDGPAIDANNGNLVVEWFYVNPGAIIRTGRGVSLRNPPSTSSIKNTFVNAVRGYGVRVEGASNALLSRITVTGVDSIVGTMGSGIEVVGGSGNTIELSTIRGTKGSQIQLTTSTSALIRQNDLAGQHQLVRIFQTSGGTAVNDNTFSLASHSDDPDNVGSSDGRSGLEITSSSGVKVNRNIFNDSLGSNLMDAIRLLNTTQADSVGGTSTSLVENRFIGGRRNVHSTGSKWDMQKSHSQGAENVIFATSGDIISLLDDTLTNATSGCVVVSGSAARFYADRVKFDNCVPANRSTALAAVDVNGNGTTKPIVRITQSAFRGPNQTAISVQTGRALIMVEDTLLGEPSTAVFGSTINTLGAVSMTYSGTGTTDSLRLSGNVIKGYSEVAAVNAGGSRLTMANNVLTRNKFGLRTNGWNSTLTFQDNEIFDNDTAGVFHTASGTFTITDTWWGDPRGTRKSPTASPTSAGDSTIATSGTVNTSSFRSTPVPLITAGAAAGVRGLRTIVTTPPSTVAVSFRVIDAGGRPVPNANVLISCSPGCTTAAGSRRLLAQVAPWDTPVATTASTMTIQTDPSGMAEIRLQLTAPSGTSTTLTGAVGVLTGTVTVVH